MNYEQLRQRFPNASEQFLRTNSDNGDAPAPVVERRPSTRTLAKSKAKGPNPTRFLVRITSFRIRLLDEDNLCEKYAVDCCRYSGILQNDDPSEAKIEVSQIKVATKAEERTEIEISTIGLASCAESAQLTSHAPQ